MLYSTALSYSHDARSAISSASFGILPGHNDCLMGRKKIPGQSRGRHSIPKSVVLEYYGYLEHAVLKRHCLILGSPEPHVLNRSTATGSEKPHQVLDKTHMASGSSWRAQREHFHSRRKVSRQHCSQGQHSASHGVVLYFL